MQSDLLLNNFYISSRNLGKFFFVAVGRGEKSISNEPRHDNKSLFFCAVNIHVDLITGGGG